MTIAFLVTIISMALLTFRVTLFTYLNSKRITCMTGMMIAMTLGMVIGITGGTMIGILFSKELFLATVTGMTLGMVVGAIVGLPVSLMAVLDGVLSGAMGGMMGAMLGIMIQPVYFDTLIKVMFVFFVSIVSILIYMLDHEIPTTRKKLKIWHNPAVFTILILSFFYFYNQLGPVL